MRKIIVTMWVTLDGFIAGPNGDMDWIGEIYDEAMGKYEDDLVSAADTLILGRVTYESFAGSWPYVPDKPNADPGEDMVIYGSASIVQALTNLGLIDEYQLLVHPVVLGGGKPLFKDIQNQV